MEQNILSEGCRDPVVVWPKTQRASILVDGHNRLKICQKHGLPYKVKKINFSSIDAVKDWMVDNQLGRRNLNPDQLSYYRGMKYISARQVKGGYKNILSKGKNELSTSEILAEHFKVSESTIKRDAKFAEGVNIIGKNNPKLKFRILSGQSKVKKTDIQILIEHKGADKLTFKNEADLFNKANRIRNEILDDVEKKIRDIQNKQVQEAHAILAEKEPFFLDRDDRLRKIKGMIVSAVNKAITGRDASGIKELKKLIDRLEQEIIM